MVLSAYGRSQSGSSGLTMSGSFGTMSGICGTMSGSGFGTKSGICGGATGDGVWHLMSALPGERELSPSPSLTILVIGFGWQRWVIGMVNGPSQIAEFRLANAAIAAYLVLRRRG